MTVFEQLRFLEMYLYDEKIKNGKRIAELYELVQYAGNVLPRLYLLITVGSVYIKSKEAPAKDVLKDMVEMCKGVQHPTRGLFLRAYLSDITKDKLPDKDSDYSGEKGGDVNDCIEFILQNFVEMNKLWVRMQHQGSARNKPKREKERRELAPLIGKNLNRLSSLEGVTLESYKNNVLPKILEQVVSCKDKIAQQYLMECVTQVFPDDYHLATLNELLEAIGRLTSDVDVRSIVISLIQRLISHLSHSKETLSHNIFPVFFSNIQKMVSSEERKIPLDDILAMLTALMDLSITCYPKKLDYVDQLFVQAMEVLSAFKEKEPDSLNNQKVIKQLISLLRSPLTNYNNILVVLQLEKYSSLLPFLSFDTRKHVAVDILKNTVESGVLIPEPSHLEALFSLLQPLLSDTEDTPKEVDEEDFREEQHLVSSLVHLFHNQDLQSLYKCFALARKTFGQGGKQRIRYTLPPLVFAIFRFARQMKDATEPSVFAESGQKVFNFALDTIKVFHEQVSLSPVSLRLYLHAAQSAGEMGFEELAYACITKSFKIYEDDISDSQQQMQALRLFISTFYSLHCFGADNYEAIITKTAKHCGQVLDKADQSELVSLAANLFNSPSHPNSQRVVECLQRSLKIADNVIDNKPLLFLSLLDRYLFFFDKDVDTITSEHINKLADLVKHTLEGVDDKTALTLFQNIRSHVQFKKKQNPTKYSPISV